MCLCVGWVYIHVCVHGGVVCTHVYASIHTCIQKQRGLEFIFMCVYGFGYICVQVNTCVCRKRGRTFSTTVLFLEPLGRLGLASPSDPHVSAWHRQCCDSMQALPCPAVCVPGSQPSSSCLHSTCPYPENHLSNTSTSLLKVNGDPKKFFI